MSSPAIYSRTKIEVFSGSAFLEIPGVTSINGPKVSRSEIDVTNMASTAVETKPAALADNGELSISCQWNPSNAVHSFIMSETNNTGSVGDRFRITFSDGTKYGMTGSFQEVSIKADNPKDGILTADVSIRISGAINFSEV